MLIRKVPDAVHNPLSTAFSRCQSPLECVQNQPQQGWGESCLCQASKEEEQWTYLPGNVVEWVSEFLFGGIHHRRWWDVDISDLLQ